VDSVDEVHAPVPAFLVGDVTLESLPDRIGFADVDGFLGRPTDEEVNARLIKPGLVLQQVELLLGEDDAEAGPVRLVHVADALWIACRGEQGDGEGACSWSVSGDEVVA
jgi:hypothetical protein